LCRPPNVVGKQAIAQRYRAEPAHWPRLLAIMHGLWIAGPFPSTGGVALWTSQPSPQEKEKLPGSKEFCECPGRRDFVSAGGPLNPRYPAFNGQPAPAGAIS
jgi:hypothetical protein